VYLVKLFDRLVPVFVLFLGLLPAAAALVV
jgi:hypothetical protein